MKKQDPAPVSHMSGFTFPKTPVEKKPAEDIEPSDSYVEMMDDTGEFEKPEEDKKEDTYESRLASAKISMDDAMRIIDDLTVKGVVYETAKVSKKLSATFASRPTKFNSYLAEVIDIADPKKVARMNQLMTEYQLAGSLVKYGDVSLPDVNKIPDGEEWEKTMQKKVEFVRSLPAPVFLALCSMVAKFDMKLMAVFSPGYEENF